MERVELSTDTINEMEEKRISMLQEEGIDERDVLDAANDDIGAWEAYFNENISKGKSDLNFATKDQWTTIERSEFNRLFKPALTFNKVNDAIKKIAGEQRQNKPDLMVRSLTGKATQDQINLRADLVRTISYQSQNDLIYQNAFKSALYMGFGAFQVGIDYESPRSFNQIINFQLIPDATQTFFDPRAVKPHKGDGNFCGRPYTISKDEFHATFPYILNPESFTTPRSSINFEWDKKDMINICDRFTKEWYPLIVYRLSNGMVVTEDEWDDLQKQFALRKELARDAIVVGGMILDEIPKIVSDRQTQDYRIMQYRLIKDRIIDFTEWPSKQLPIIFVDGDSTFIDGQQQTRSFIHDAKDAQRFVNYVGSEIAAEIKNRRREQWIGTPDNVVGNELMWRNPELQNGILIAKPDPKTNQLPQKLPPWDLSPALLAQYQRGTMDIKEILGFFDDNLGAESNAVSGVAITNRQLAGSKSAMIFFDNLNQAIEQAGRVVLDLLPVVYGNDERHVVISKADGKTQSLVLNKKNEDGTVENAMESGDYDIEIDTGPSFAVQKSQALQLFTQVIGSNPQVFPLIADLYAKNFDIQFQSQIVERFKTLVPPQVLAKEEGREAPPAPPSPQDQMMQAEMQLRQQQLADRAEELRIRQEKHELEKAELIMKAKKLSADMNIDQEKLSADMHKSELDFSASIAKVLADLHK